MATILTDREIFAACCALKAMQILLKDGCQARALDYLDFQEQYGGENRFDKVFIADIKSVEKKYLAALKSMKSPVPKKYNKK